MTEKDLIQKIYEKCRYNISLSAEDLDAMPEAFEYGQLKGIHDTAYEMLSIIDKFYNKEDADQ